MLLLDGTLSLLGLTASEMGEWTDSPGCGADAELDEKA